MKTGGKIGDNPTGGYPDGRTMAPTTGPPMGIYFKEGKGTHSSFEVLKICGRYEGLKSHNTHFFSKIDSFRKDLL